MTQLTTKQFRSTLRRSGYIGEETMLKPSFLAAVMLLLLPSNVHSEVNNGLQTIENRIGTTLHPQPTYMIIAPSLVRADEVVQVYVNIYKVSGASLLVSLSIRKDGEEHAGVSHVFTRPGSKILQLKMLPTTEIGNYTLRLEGYDHQRSGLLFVNETKILFHTKRVSCFIQTDKAFYKMKQTVKYRIIAMTHNQLPVKSGSITIYIKAVNLAGNDIVKSLFQDAKDRTVRRYIGRQLFNGVYEGSLATTHPMRYGWWSIVVHAWGHVYRGWFRVEGHFPEMFYVNVSMPSYVKDNEYALAGVITANYTSGRIMEGNATVYLEIKSPGEKQRSAVMKETLLHFKGVGSFFFRLEDIAKHTKTLVGTELYIRAVVWDFYIELEKEGKATAIIKESVVRLRFLGGPIRVFRPGVPFDVYVAAYESDGSKLSREQSRMLHIEKVIQRSDGSTRSQESDLAIVPDDSIVKYTLRPPHDASSLIIRAGFAENRMIELVATRHYTRSKHHLTITSSTKTPEVNKYIVFTVRATDILDEMHYLIAAAGKILLANTLSLRNHQKTFSLATSRDMVPEARIVVYCVLPDGEVLTDSLHFYVAGMNAEEIDVEINKGKDFSSKNVEITANTFGSTFIAFSTMDYDVYRNGGNREIDGNVFFTRIAVENEIMSYEPIANSSFAHTWLLDENKLSRSHFTAPSYGIDANQTFAFAGLTVLTDAHVTRIPGIFDCNYTLGFKPCFDGGCFSFEQECDGVKACSDGADEMGCPDPQVQLPSRPEEFMSLQRMWYYFDSADWGWKSLYTKPQGNIEFQAPMPVRSTTWVIGAFALDRIKGLVFTEHPTRLDTTKPFYIIVETTPTAAAGEQLGVRVTAFNYWDQTIEAIITLPRSDKYAFVNVEDNGWASSYQPRTTKAAVQTMVLLTPGTQKWVFFTVIPLVKGKVGIKVNAESPINRQTVTKTVTIRDIGVTNVYHTPYLINLVSQGSVIVPNLEIPVPERFYEKETRELLYVPGSGKAEVTIVGDVMGPGFFSPVLNLRKLTDYGEGHGVDYVFSLAANLYWLQFMRNTNQLDPKVRMNALDGMVLYFKSILSYIQANGGMAMRRQRTKDSVWLTAFTLEVLATASDPEWEDMLFIDVDIMNNMALYMFKQQNFSTGAFSFTTNILDRNFDSLHFDVDGTPLNISLTAFLVISLSKSIPVLTGEAQSRAVESKNLAAGYLALHLTKLKDPFQLCLVTYALYKANHRAKGQAFNLMDAVKRKDNYIYWSSVPVPRDPVKIINTVPFQLPRPLPQIHGSRAIQATSYALLVYLLNNRFEESEPIMTWLQRQRHSDHGFGGLLDTIIALQALKAYGERIANRDIYRMTVKLEATGFPQWQHTVNLKQTNFMEYKKFMVEKNHVYGSIRATAKGTGLALLQLRTEVNVEHPFQLRSQQRPEDTRSFDLEMDKVLFYGRNASHILYRICMRWAREDLAPTSGAAILEVDIPSGYHVIRRYLQVLTRAGPLNQHRVRSPWGKVFAYYDYIPAQRQCIEFKAQRWYPIANATIQHSVRIYDTFEPGLQNSTLYTTYTLFHLHVCQVCGSFQCPYCPFYNASPPSIFSTSLIIIILTFNIVLWECVSRSITHYVWQT